MITALAFVPPEDVAAYFEILSIEIEAVFPSLQPILDWLESHYIGMLRREGVRRIPAFPIPTWNLYNRVLAEQMVCYIFESFLFSLILIHMQLELITFYLKKSKSISHFKTTLKMFLFEILIYSKNIFLNFY